jgi:16S rRNA (uracil1498-N3)-methyltransferase
MKPARRGGSVTSRRFFIEGVRSGGERVEITGSDAHKIENVLRLKAGDRIEIVDSASTVFSARIEYAGGKPYVLLGETSGRSAADFALRIDIAQAIPKGQKMDFVVEKSTELGAHAILPFYSERTVVHDLGWTKLERWRRIARSAAAQCGRDDVAAVERPLSFEALLERFAAYDRVLFPWELALHRPLAAELKRLLKGVRRALVVVGPEGGFAHAEAEAAQRRGAVLIWLGRRILRTETAALAVLAVVEALFSGA